MKITLLIKVTLVSVAGLLIGFFHINSVLGFAPDDFGLREGDLIRAGGDTDVYIVNQHGYKRLFLNPTIFNFYGHLGGWHKVKTITPKVRDGFETSLLFRNCETNDYRIYTLKSTGGDAARLHWLNVSADTALMHDKRFFEKVFCINNSEYEWYIRGSSLSTMAEIYTAGSDTKKAVIIEVALADTEYQDNTGHIDKTFIELVNAPGKYSIVKAASGNEVRFDSLNGIDDWFAEEYERITGTKKDIFDIDIVGPFIANEAPPARERYDPPCDILNPYFQQIAKENNIDIKNYDFVNFVFFDDLKRASPSQLERRFVSCAVVGSPYTTFTDFITYFAGIHDGFITIAHEMFHGLGAQDSYKGSFTCYDQGFPEPDKQPRYPQSKACLMCGNIQIAENMGQSTNSLAEVMICEDEAKDAGWIK